MLKINSPELDLFHPLIQSAVRAIPESDHYLIALSGGLDSMALLKFALPYLLKFQKTKIQVIHIHHGLSPYADDWAIHCQSVCRDLNVECHVERVSVVSEGQGLEAAARKARYSVFESYLAGGGVLLQGHHQNDQAETVLMRLLRGAGPEGLSGIPQQRALSNGQLFRPWLNLPRDMLEQEINKYPIKWVEDESNTDLQFDRNFLRHKILPLLEARWPDVLNSFSRTAERSEQTIQYLLSWCDEQKQSIFSDDYSEDQALDLTGLSGFSDQQQRLLVRYWLDCLQVEHPSEKILERLWTELIPAEKDAMPALRWGDNHLRRFDGCLFYLTSQQVDECPYEYKVVRKADLLSCSHLIGGRDLKIMLEPKKKLLEHALSIRAPRDNEVVTVRSRQGGESIILSGSTQHKSLKKILQAKKVAPWMRSYIPLIYYGDVLALVMLGSNEGGLIADGFQANEGEVVVTVCWR